MSSCREIEPLLAAFVDGSATAEERREVEAHARRCPPCQRRVVCEGTAHAAIAAHRGTLRGCAPGDLRARCAAYHRGPEVPVAAVRAGWLRRPWVPLSLAATLVVALAGILLFGLNDSVEALTTQLAVDHVKCFQFAGSPSAPVEVASLERRWSDTHGWSLAVPPSVPGMRLELRDVRRCLTLDGKVAHVMYQWGGEPLSVFVLPQLVNGARDAQRLVGRLGQEAVVWSQRGRTYVVMTRRPPADLDSVVGYMRTHAH
jgi:anti-sigma factor RsiW